MVWAALGAMVPLPPVFSLFLEASWGVLGASWWRLGASWGRIGASWGRLGRSWRRLGGVLGASWALLGASLGRLGASSNIDLNLESLGDQKTLKFLDFYKKTTQHKPV